MIYLSSFKLSNKKLKNPNIYPYSVFKDKYRRRGAGQGRGQRRERHHRQDVRDLRLDL